MRRWRAAWAKTMWPRSTRASPKRWPPKWQTDGPIDGDHYKLAFDKPGTWSQKYNLVWDRILGFNLFPASVRQNEIAFYLKHLNRFGLPLDNRKDYTKLDWQIWTATLADKPADWNALLDPIGHWINEGPTPRAAHRLVRHQDRKTGVIPGPVGGGRRLHQGAGRQISVGKMAQSDAISFATVTNGSHRSPADTKICARIQTPVTLAVHNRPWQKNAARERYVKKTVLAVCLLALALGAAQAQKLTGAGATFPYPIYSKWFTEYSSAHPGVEVNYQSIGSGGGITQVTKGTVDFGASDMPMTDQALAASPIKLMHIPTVLGAVVPVFNVPGVQDLKFSGDVLADIFLGKITNWNDAADRQGQSGREAARPEDHRGASRRGQRYHLHLDRLPEQGQQGVGRRSRQRHSALNWPTGVAGKGNEGVAGLVRQMPGAHRLRRADLRAAEQDRLRRGEECFRQLRQGLDRGRDGGGGQHQADARRLPHLHHQRSGRQRVSDFELHLPADPHHRRRCRPSAKC